MTTIYLVQHGDKERMPGDPGLTELGRGQAVVTARWLQGIGLHSLYSSPLRRARETAAPIGHATGLVTQVDSRLRERLNWDGTKNFDAFLADWDRSTKDRDLVPGNGESSRSAGERLRIFLVGLAGASGPVAPCGRGPATGGSTGSTERVRAGHLILGDGLSAAYRVTGSPPRQTRRGVRP